jgi:large subunit ribosomal protein L28
VSPRPVGVIRAKESPVSNVCQVTGRRPAFGNNVSHSHRKTRRRWNPNIQKKRYWVPSEKRWVTLTLSAKGIKIIDKQGIERVLADLRRRGEKV